MNQITLLIPTSLNTAKIELHAIVHILKKENIIMFAICLLVNLHYASQLPRALLVMTIFCLH